jgi:hypothetical protein
MKHGPRLAAILGAAACLIVGGALGGGLLNAGAATSKGSSTATNGQTQGSNEDPAHEKGESAAREAAEDNGTATFGHRGDCHHGGRGGSDGSSQQDAPSTGSTPSTPAT